VELVRAHQAAFASGDRAALDATLAPDAVHHAGMTVRRGRAAFAAIAAADRTLHPFGSLRTGERRLVAEGDWVAALVDREALTNAGAHHENLHATFHEVRGGRVTTRVDLLDFRIAAERCDLTALTAASDAGPDGVESAVPVARAALPDPTDGSEAAEAKRTVVRFLDAFLTFDPTACEALLIADPVHRVGLVRRQGRAGFAEIAAAGRAFYPHGIRERTFHVLVAHGGTVAALVSLQATSNRGLEYHNLYGMFFDLHDGLVASMVEVLDNRVPVRVFDYGVLS
jgi:ketosteroid isomerase-like protein